MRVEEVELALTEKPSELAEESEEGEETKDERDGAGAGGEAVVSTRPVRQVSGELMGATRSVPAAGAGSEMKIGGGVSNFEFVSDTGSMLESAHARAARCQRLRDYCAAHEEVMDTEAVERACEMPGGPVAQHQAAMVCYGDGRKSSSGYPYESGRNHPLILDITNWLYDSAMQGCKRAMENLAEVGKIDPRVFSLLRRVAESSSIGEAWFQLGRCVDRSKIIMPKKGGDREMVQSLRANLYYNRAVNLGHAEASKKVSWWSRGTMFCRAMGEHSVTLKSLSSE